MVLLTFFILVLIKQCFGVIYHLNDTEYYRMPPLSSLDKYDECLHRPGGLYCLARFYLFADSQNDLMTIIQEYSAYSKKHFNHTYVERGVCVTKSCSQYLRQRNVNSSEDLNKIIETCVNASIWNNYGIQAKLALVHNCDRYNEETKIDFSDWVIVGFISFLVIINIIGTLYDLLCNQNNLEMEKETSNAIKILLSFSIVRNWMWLTSSEPTDKRLKNLRGLHCIKIIMTSLMIISHAIFINASPFTENPHDFEKTYETTGYQLMYNGMMFVQIFFVISGFLMVFNLELIFENKKVTWKIFPKIMLLRWLRLSPAYFVVLGFTATWLRHLGSGPLWKYIITNRVVADCRRNWWLHLLYVNNYVETNSYCGIQTWHLAADIQLFTLGLVVYIWTKNNNRRNLALCLMFLLGMVVPAFHVWYQDLDGIIIKGPELYRTFENDNLRWLYFPGHSNLTSYVIGMSLGYIFYNLKNFKQTHNPLYDTAFGLLIWSIPIVLARYSLTGGMFYEDGEKVSLAVRMAYAATQRVIIGGLIALLILLSLGMRLNESSRKFLEWRGWLVPSRLSYSVYLLHLNLIHILLGTKHQLGHVSFFYMIVVYFAVTAMSFLMALPFYLAVEAPMGRLIKTFMTNKVLAKKHTS